jgi:hypothetical protein
MFEQENSLDSGGISLSIGLSYFNNVVVNLVSSHVLIKSVPLMLCFVPRINICEL